MNDAGDAVGVVLPEHPVVHFRRGGEAVRLPAPPGTTAREASAVNETGTEMAGISVTTSGVAVPTRWECPAGQML